MTDEMPDGGEQVPPARHRQPGEPPGQRGQPQYQPPRGYGQSGHGQFGYGPANQPPPGYGQSGYGPPNQPPPGYGQSGYGQPPYPPPPGYGRPGYGPGWPGAAAPGGIPLRPLALGDIYSGAVGSARRNPLATFGLATIILTASAVLTTLLRLWAEPHASNGLTPVTTTQTTVSGLIGLPVFVITLLAQFVLTGMLTTVIGQGVLGRKIGIGEAWRTSRPGSVIGAALLLLLIQIGVFVPVVVLVIVLAVVHAGPAAVAVGIIGGLGTLVAFILIGVRLCLTMPSVVLERLGPGRAIKRSWELSRGSFWRLFGIKLLTYIIIAVAAFIIELPFVAAGGAVTFAGGLTTSSLASAGTTLILLTAVAQIVAYSLMLPMKCGVTVLLYVDLRIRREGLDLALQNAVQGQQLTGDEFARVWRPPAAGAWQQQGQWQQHNAAPGGWPQQGQPGQWPQQGQPGQWPQQGRPGQWPQQGAQPGGWPQPGAQPPERPGQWPAQGPPATT